jgi:hypothetical protein
MVIILSIGLSHLPVTPAYETNQPSTTIDIITPSYTTTIEISGSSSYLNTLYKDLYHNLIVDQESVDSLSVLEVTIEKLYENGYLNKEEQDFVLRAIRISNRINIFENNKFWQYNSHFEKRNYFCTIAFQATRVDFGPLHKIRPSHLINSILWQEQISFGLIEWGHHWPVVKPSMGWIWTEGLLGNKNWTGEFTGNIFNNDLLGLYGIVGFTGVRITHDNQHTFIGRAKVICIDQPGINIRLCT